MQSRTETLKTITAWNSRLHIVLFCTLLYAVAVQMPAQVIAPNTLPENPHHFNQACATCHQIDLNAPNLESRIGTLIRPVNQTCSQSGCHTVNDTIDHPIDVKPSGKIPADMPLDNHSRLTCLTCHDESAATKNYPHFLRRHPEDLCRSCHVSLGRTTKEKSHWQFTSKAHLSTSQKKKNNTRFIGGIDIESRNCISCHDSINITIIPDNDTHQQKLNRWSHMTDHPIGMTYTRAVRKKPGEYHFQGSLDHQVRFFNGKVGCGSCHNLYNKSPKHLVAPSRKGELCKKCHNKGR